MSLLRNMLRISTLTDNPELRGYPTKGCILVHLWNVARLEQYGRRAELADGGVRLP